MTTSIKKLYIPPAVTTDVVIFTIEEKKLKVLLIKRTQTPFKNTLALPGGFLHNHEISLETAKRILKEKAGIKNFYIEQLYTFDSTKRDPRGRILTIAYFALVARNKLKLLQSKKLQTPSLYVIEKMPKLAFDHNKIIAYALKRLRAKFEYTNIAYSLLPKQFTFNQLQNVYEAIFNRKVDKRNFRKKFLELKIVQPTKNILKGARQRPARLYKFVFNRSIEFKKFFW